jgi:hypothetical protein
MEIAWTISEPWAVSTLARPRHLAVAHGASCAKQLSSLELFELKPTWISPYFIESLHGSA